MEDIIKTLVILVLAGFITLLIAGATNKVVIYFDIKDFLISFAPWATMIVTFILLAVYKKEGATEILPPQSVAQYIILFAGSIIAVVFFIWSIKLSIFYNRNTALGIIVGLFKVLTALLGTLAIISQIQTLRSNKSTLKDAIWALILISIFMWLGKKLINGEQVYIAKGWAMPKFIKIA